MEVDISTDMVQIDLCASDRSFAFTIVLFAFLKATDAYGTANVWQWCKNSDVYCATVQGCAPGTAPGQCPGVQWHKLDHGGNITVKFDDRPSGTGITIMCTRDLNASPIRVTQLEWTWEQGQGLVYFDVSNVAGTPFVDEGFLLHSFDARDLDKTKNRCFDAWCDKNDASCNGVYEVWNDDEKAMRSCYDDAILGLQLCH
ncbi:hypothetical protein A1O7_07003 [Cladophialophora yegresii CBS 114405]|uniref:Uncharacterized protein n=1 Tax=Cladophialophora yegresii CBS 114405 TaxID=1182544 RepID=W9WDQ3_9EURO|nr:uncharacterized protein A1O7_07003 [Cladophialophora yegresii CBS 114405]EXJ56659.1 hypothetical protein A1O7_07003 [Cladophialophora yegresii CBS 114405]